MPSEILIGIALIVMVVLTYFIVIFNDLVRLKNNISKAWSNIDVLLKQRYDEIPNVVKFVKGYVKHEKETLEKITKLRALAVSESGIGKLAAENDIILESLKTIFAVVENYPELKANQNFLKLQSRLAELENEIADRREFYNDIVTNYNTRIESFPDAVVAKTLKFNRMELFRASEEEKKAVEVGL